MYHGAVFTRMQQQNRSKRTSAESAVVQSTLKTPNMTSWQLQKIHPTIITSFQFFSTYQSGLGFPAIQDANSQRGDKGEDFKCVTGDFFWVKFGELAL